MWASNSNDNVLRGMNDPNPYLSPRSELAAPDADLRKLLARRAVKCSWCATFAFVLLVCCARAIHHKHHGGADDPEFLLAGLSLLSVVAAFVFAVIAIIRGIKCKAFFRTTLYVLLPFLLSGGIFAFVLWMVNSYE
jgi:hypothetical protein